GEALNVLPRQAPGFFRPALPGIIGAPDAVLGGGKHRAPLPGAIEMKGEHLAGRPRAERPRFSRIAREPAAATARTGQNEVWIRRIDRDLSAQRIFEIADGRESFAPI